MVHADAPVAYFGQIRAVWLVSPKMDIYGESVLKLEKLQTKTRPRGVSSSRTIIGLIGIKVTSCEGSKGDFNPCLSKLD